VGSVPQDDTTGRPEDGADAIADSWGWGAHRRVSWPIPARGGVLTVRSVRTANERTAGDAFGLPVGISFMAGAWSEPVLIRLASGFEAAAKARRKPQFLPTLPTNGSARKSLGRGPKKPTTAPLVGGL
jgi:hypothetical protein